MGTLASPRWFEEPFRLRFDVVGDLRERVFGESKSADVNLTMYAYLSDFASAITFAYASSAALDAASRAAMPSPP